MNWQSFRRLFLPAGQSPQTALRESEQRFGAAFEHAALGIAHIALDGRMLRVNRRLCEMHGYSREELLRLRAGDLMADAGASGRESLRSLITGEQSTYTAVHKFIRKNGQAYAARVSVTLVKEDTPEPYIVSIVEDISQLLASQQRVREQSDMLDQANDAIVVHELDRRVRYWNQGAQRLFGWTAEQAMGRTITQLLGAAAALSDEAAHTLLARGDWVAEVVCRAADGRVLEVERRFTVIHDEGNSPVAVLSVSADITQRKHAERQVALLQLALEARIRERTAQLEESNQELRTFSYSIAHDLRAPLSSIDGFSTVLQERLGHIADDTSRHFLQRMRTGVRQMSNLIDALLALAHLSDAELLRDEVDLSALAHEWLSRKREQDPSRSVDMVIHATPPVTGDKVLLSDMLENLLGNAWKFTSKRAHAHIEFGAVQADGITTFHLRDNGAGFDPALAAKLFSPFQRLHGAREFEGTGIGLAVVRKIVSRHGGRVWAEALDGQGASFYFTLPAHHPPPGTSG
ncbi:MAG: PAS domain S-box protein [Ramlibacter sp.]|nr:PAS domain S-box protein [Ramlibacter sp.]